MKDIDSLTTTDNCNVIASIQPSRLSIDYEGRSIVSIDLATGEVEIQDEAHQIDAARIFWEAISVYGRNIVKERDEAIALLRRTRGGVELGFVTEREDFLTSLEKA